MTDYPLIRAHPLPLLWPFSFLWRWAACRRHVARGLGHLSTFPVLWIEPWQVVGSGLGVYTVTLDKKFPRPRPW